VKQEQRQRHKQRQFKSDDKFKSNGTANLRQSPKQWQNKRKGKIKNHGWRAEARRYDDQPAATTRGKSKATTKQSNGKSNATTKQSKSKIEGDGKSKAAAKSALV
jgi:hypothetical protein